MYACLRQFVTRRLPVIPVLLPDAPAIPKLPLFLEGFTWVDLRGGLTKQGLEKLVWGITGIRPGGLFSLPLTERIIKSRSKAGATAPEMVILPTGCFQMGDSNNTGAKDEQPPHLVTIAQPFAMARQVVTYNEYIDYARATGLPCPPDEGWGQSCMPAIHISWEDATAYAKWLSKKIGEHYRLPSEAEWEYAARAGTLTDYWWGNDYEHDKANCDDGHGKWSGKQTSPVRSFDPNPWGLYDMTGNVLEWVQDRWHDDYNGAPDDGSAWEIGDSPYRVLRGGSWYNTSYYCRNSCRHKHQGHKYCNVGFRLVCSSIFTVM